jgi:YVTN family beta-propeller protein
MRARIVLPETSGAGVCPTAPFVANNLSGSVSTIDVKTRTKHPTDIPVGSFPDAVAITPDGKTAFVTHASPRAGDVAIGDSVSAIDVKTRTKGPTDIMVGPFPVGAAVTPCRR